MTTVEFLTDLATRRNVDSLPGSGIPHRWVELFGGTLVEVTAFEPDPYTYRHLFYYNAITNIIYKRVVTDTGLCFWSEAKL